MVSHRLQLLQTEKINAQEDTSFHHGSSIVLFLEFQTLREASVTPGMKLDDHVVV
jgi:hypothetical protein